MVVFGGDGSAVEFLVDLGEEECQAGLGVGAASVFEREMDVFDGLLVFFLRDGGLDHSEVEFVDLRAAEVAFGEVLHEDVERGFGFGKTFFPGHAAGQEDGTFVAGAGAFEL